MRLYEKINKEYFFLHVCMLPLVFVSCTLHRKKYIGTKQVWGRTYAMEQLLMCTKKSVKGNKNGLCTLPLYAKEINKLNKQII